MSYWTQEAERRSRLPKSSVWLRPLSEGEGRLVQAKKEKIARAIRNAHLFGKTYSIPGPSYPHQRPWLKYKVYETK
jgi:hypothetical protein